MLSRAIKGWESRKTVPSAATISTSSPARCADALASLPEADREILLMRTSDELPFEEVGCLLGIEPPAARKRYGRALVRLQTVLTDGGLTESEL